MWRALIVCLGLVLAACGGANDLDRPPVPLGDFALGHNVVIAPNLVKGPLSREANKEDITKAVKDAIQARFGRYEGDKLYHLGISIEAYVLAQVGVPLVLAPKSVLILRATVWDDETQTKLNEEVKEINILESFSGNTFLGSGLTQTKEVQLENLARNAAKQIEIWMLQMHREEGWFGTDEPAGTTTSEDAAAAAPDTGAVPG